MKPFKLSWIVSSAVLICVLSCAENTEQNGINEASVSHENHFFKLDFDSSDYTMTDIEQYFFTTFPHDDPTEGDVVYDRTKWVNRDMIQLVNKEGLYLYIKKREDAFFDSFRLTSKTFYNLDKENQRILFVFKGQLPSARGIWPAWWLNGGMQDPWIYKNSAGEISDADLDEYSGKGHFYDTPSAVNVTDWPSSGEIDIIETINGDSLIHNTIHTCPQMCDSEWNNDGQVINCANARDGDPNTGCSGQPYTAASPEGTFACLWTVNTLTFYYWPPGSDVRAEGGPLSDNPQPGNWQDDVKKNEVRLLETDVQCNSTEYQQWQCDNCAQYDQCTFNNMKMIFNATLCGKWAGNTFDESGNALQNCRSFINGEGEDVIDKQYMKIEYVSVSRI